MRDKLWFLLLSMLLAALLLVACGPGPTPTIYVPLPPIPTVTPPPSAAEGPTPTAPPALPTAPPACTDKASFDSDVTVPPGTSFLPGQPFIKTWRLRNVGTCTWTTEYVLAFYTGDRMAGAAVVPFPVAVPEGSTVDLSVALVSPAGAGTYEGRWRLQNAGGAPFGIVESADGSFGVRIVVVTTPVTPTVTVTPSPAATPTPSPTVGPTAGPPPVITDWKGEYFSNRDLDGTPFIRNDLAIDFDWGQNAPFEGLPADNFSVRWTRVLDFTPGPYRFRATVDDGMRLWVDDHLVLDDWQYGATREIVRDWTLAPGEHTIRVEYFDAVGNALIRVTWDNLSAMYPDWLGQYWTNADLRGAPALTQNEGSINFDWGPGSFAGGMPVDNFSARWSRVVNLEAGTYRFHMLVDDGGRLWVDDKLIIDAWQDGSARQETAEVTLTAGPHLLRVEYYERGGDAQMRVWWEK